ncbi:peptidase domain-containing ABC transporter [Xanthovirga aplysinae]|uniref:peptidase domain-containing ABC transporter n=1 Tax=Xanthovirga aplysinae TaxID=2529853 RepID=UPI0012BB5B16|nr:peptidase domain-containing ABC transporter [Xanthovirga aplysinae]MTI31234.1 peptidase domain-containing ABC transporter [Xanthovirga aplysinae]
MRAFPFYRQLDTMDCGPTCLRMIAKYYGKVYSLQSIREKSYISREGVSLLGISDAAESIGFRTLSAKIPFDKLKEEAPVPFIAHWRQRHFVVVYGFKRDKVLVADPGHGLIKYSKKEFLDGWLSDKEKGAEIGVVLLLEPSPDFYSIEDEKGEKKNSFGFLLNYLKPYKKYIIQLFLGMVVASLLQLLFPFLTQSIVDVGIQNQNISFINLILIAQLMLFASRTAVEFIRSWILLHIGTRINISIISDFLIKLMKLPLSFFDIKMIGDLLQRIGDHKRIETFLTSSALSILFSLVNLLIFGLVLIYYDSRIFAVFFVGSLLYLGWILLFMRKRRDLDFKQFEQLSANQSNLIQLITGMQEIKLHNSEKQKRWEWERLQAKLFKVSVKGLALQQYQQVGSVFINEVKNIFISFLAAKAVIDGEITLGMMLAIQYIIGQMNVPINDLVNFMRVWQDAKISLERMGEIHSKEDEEKDPAQKVMNLPEKRSLKVRNLSFNYEGPHAKKVLRNINIEIPKGKITAIVGASGSGKTTLVKLLLKFYQASEGEIQLGGMNLNIYSNRVWRGRCGAVLQDGFIFSDTIARNIAVSDEYIDNEKLLEASRIANIQTFIDSLPLGYNTKIGSDGHGLSQGQRQRLLIARSVYKNPEFIFFDEATNALDANNEKVIMENLDQFFEGRTVVVVAHRLSTVKNADQILVMDQGEIIEKGDHQELTQKRGAYFELVKNQLELGN